MRVGRIGYINCYPVYGAIDRGEVKLPAELVTGTPAELNDLLVAGGVDVFGYTALQDARPPPAPLRPRRRMEARAGPAVRVRGVGRQARGCPRRGAPGPPSTPRIPRLGSPAPRPARRRRSSRAWRTGDRLPRVPRRSRLRADL